MYRKRPNLLRGSSARARFLRAALAVFAAFAVGATTLTVVMPASADENCGAGGSFSAEVPVPHDLLKTALGTDILPESMMNPQIPQVDGYSSADVAFLPNGALDVGGKVDASVPCLLQGDGFLPGWAAKIIGMAVGAAAGSGMVWGMTSVGVFQPVIMKDVYSFSSGFFGTMVYDVLTTGTFNVKTVGDSIVNGLLGLVEARLLKEYAPAILDLEQQALNAVRSAVGVGWFSFLAPSVGKAVDAAQQLEVELTEIIARL